ncbi:MAG: hypothetical protein WDA08_01685 [Weeksellaceae bacterium]
MKNIYCILITLLFFGLEFPFAQQVRVLNLDKPDVSFRGLSVLDNSILWVCGTKGTIGFSMNDGRNFHWVNPKGYEDRDFRGIAVLDYKTAVAIAVGSPAIIIRTHDSGKTWREVYRDESPDAFLDAIQFPGSNPNFGMVIGDPVGGKHYYLKSTDGGNNWEKLADGFLPAAAGKETYFAASNSSLKIIDEETFLAVSGGEQSHLIGNIVSPFNIVLPKSPSPTAGANAIDYNEKANFGLIVGGDFEKPEDSENNLFVFELEKGKTPIISVPETAPTGYKSGVVIINSQEAIACGPSGVDFSSDNGKNWEKISETSYHACIKAKYGAKVYLVGPEGRIGYLRINK